MERISATEARIHFGEILRKVTEQGPVLVERRGQPQVVILSAADYRKLKGSDCNVEDALRLCSMLRRESRRD